MNALDHDALYWAVRAGVWKECAERHIAQAREAKRNGLSREHICGWVELALSAQRMFVQDLRLARGMRP